MADTVDSDRVREHNEEHTEAFQKKLNRLAKLVKNSKYTVFFTGAGVSTSAGVGDYRGPSGAWTQRKIKQLERKTRTSEEDEELRKLKEEQKREEKKAKKHVPMTDAQPTPTHMAMATLIKRGIAHYVITTNLDGIYRKAGLQGHTQLCCLHGDIYIERCTACGYDFERNYEVRQDFLHVHDHKAGVCERCGSAPPKHYTGRPDGIKMKGSKWGGQMIGTKDKNCGTKDTHINFGECLDEMDWNEAEYHCGKADLCIIAGTSMSLRHITHFPFMARKTVLINLQPTPDDYKANLRIWAKCDPVFEGLMQRLKVEIEPIPVWRPRDAQPIDKIPWWVHPYYVEAAKRLEEMALLREAEVEDRKEMEQLEAKVAVVAMEEDKEEKKKEKNTKKKNNKKNKNKKDKKEKMEEDGGEVEVVVGNTHSMEGDLHAWTAFVRLSNGKEAELVDRVDFKLHPTFTPMTVTVKKAPFEVERVGWGSFTVGMTIHWKSELRLPSTQVSHKLIFSEPESSALVAVVEM